MVASLNFIKMKSCPGAVKGAAIYIVVVSSNVTISMVHNSNWHQKFKTSSLSRSKNSEPQTHISD